MSWSPVQKPPMMFTPYWLDSSQGTPMPELTTLGRPALGR